MRDEWCGRFEFELCFSIGEPRRGLFIASSINLGQEHEYLVSIAQFQKQCKKQGLEQDYRAGGIVGMIIMFAQWIVYLVFWNLCFLSVQVVAWLRLVCFDLDCSGIHRKIDRALHLRLSPSCFLPKHSIHLTSIQVSNIKQSSPFDPLFGAIYARSWAFSVPCVSEVNVDAQCCLLHWPADASKVWSCTSGSAMGQCFYGSFSAKSFLLPAHLVWMT